MFHGIPSRKFPQEIQSQVRRKLYYLDAARSVDDLRRPPGNRLKLLEGKLFGWYSIRVNRQWRIIFRWHALGPKDVQLTDYH